MPSTSYNDVSAAVAAIQARTNAAGAAVDDTSGAEGRLWADFWAPGVLGATSWQVVPGAALSVNVGVTVDDLAVVPGLDPGQGNYLVRPGGAPPHNVPLTAAHSTNDRIDQIYLAVQDIAYDGGTISMPRISRRTGDPGASPSAPGPDAAWSAYLLLATILVNNGATSLTGGDITDERDQVTSVLALPVHASSHAVGGSDPLSLHEEVDGSVEVASFSLTASLSSIATVALAIPAHWASWKCSALATGLHRAPFQATNGASEWQIQIDGTNQQLNTPVETLDNVLQSFAVGGRRTGMVTTGSRSVILRARYTLGPADLQDIYLYARAVRTS